MVDDSPPLARVYQLSDPSTDLRSAAQRVHEALGLLDLAQADVSRAVRRGKGSPRALALRLAALGVGNVRWRVERLLRELEQATGDQVAPAK